MLEPAGRAAVIGAGLLVEARALIDLGWRVDALETEESIARRPDAYREFSKLPGAKVVTSVGGLGRGYRLATLTHVVEFVQDPSEREALVRTTGARLATAGCVLLSLRGWGDANAAKNKTPSGDGIITGLGTWTRGYTVAEAEDLVVRCGLEISGGPRTSKSTAPKQVWLVCKRK